MEATGEPLVKPVTTDEKALPAPRLYPDIPSALIPLYDDLTEQIHVLNMVRYLFGEPKVVSSRFSKGILNSVLDAGYNISLEFGSVNLGTWTESYTACYKDSLVKIKAPPPLYRNTTASVCINQEGVYTSYPRVGFKWAFEAEVDAFLAAILQSSSYTSGAEDSAKDLRLAEDLVRAISTPS